MAKIPEAPGVVGYASHHGGLDHQLYFPLGRRRVVYVLPEDPPTRLRALGATHLLLDGEALKASKSPVGDWLQRYDAELVDTMRQDFGPETSAECYLLRLRAVSPPATK